MKKETTPIKITDKVMELCSRTVSGVKPIYVPVEIQKGSLLHECFLNIRQMLQKRGG